jgi:hypothetical protein
LRLVNPASEEEILAQAATAIRPKLALLEARRKAYLLLTKLVVTGVFGVMALAALVLWALLGGYVALFALAGGLAFAGLAFLACLKLYKGSARGEIVPPLADALGLVYSAQAPDFDVQRLVALELLPPCEAASATDLVRGRHRDTGFRMAEVRCWIERVQSMKTGTRRRRDLQWQGLVVEVEVPAPFVGPVILSRDRGRLLNAVDGRPGQIDALRRVQLADAAFEKVFEVFAADPAEAERLLQPGLRESLLALSEARPGRALGAAFAEGLFILALPTKGRILAQGRLFQPAETLLQELPQALRELTLPQRVIDYLHGDRPGPLL